MPCPSDAIRVLIVSVFMTIALSEYILLLSNSASETKFAADRPTYQLLLANAAVLLAIVVRGADHSQIENAVNRHERLWGNTFLQDEVFRKPLDAFAEFKKQMHSAE